MNILSDLESYLDLKIIEKVFLILSLVLMMLMPIDYSRMRLSINRPMHSNSSSNGSYIAISSKPFEPLPAYEASLEKSVIFGLYNPAESLSVLKSSIAELTKDYRLKGVMILAEPEAILEDARTQKSIFVKEGDSVGELKVKSIREGALVFGYCGEEKELKI